MTCPLILLLVLLGAGPVPQTSGHSVAIDVTGLDQKTFDDYALADCYKSLLVRIVQENLTAVDTGSQAQIEVFLARKGSGIEITVSAARYQKSAVVELRGENTDDLHLQIIHQVMDLIREACNELEKLPKSLDEEPVPAAARPPVEKKELPPAVRPVATKNPAKVVLEKSPYQLSVGLGSLGVWNPDSFGFMFTQNTRFSAGSGLGAELGIGMLLPVGLDREIQVTEWGVSAGASYRVALISERLFLDLGLAAGFWQHFFEYTGAGDYESQGDRFDFIASGTIRLAVSIGSGLEIQALAGALFNPKERIHRVADRELYHSPNVRGVFGVFMAYRFRL